MRIRELEERVKVLEEQLGVLNEGLLHANHNIELLANYNTTFLNKLVEIGLIRIKKKLTTDDIMEGLKV